jgi:chromosome segregation ATPase
MEKKTGTIQWIAGGALAALLVANAVLFHRVSRLERDLADQRITAQTQLTELREATAASAATMSRGFEELTAQLREGTRTASAQAQRAAVNVQKNTERLLAQLEEQQRAADQRIAQEVAQELHAVKSLNAAQNEKVAGLESNLGAVEHAVGVVREEVANAKSELERTIADLKSVRGDLGVQSGLIATNARELAALRELGERSYYEFTIPKGSPVKVANLTITLKKVDPKRNKYNVDILADDKRVEKKDKTINEPVQLYVGGARQPYEIVVNEVRKDTIVGYVAAPKLLRAASR